MFGGTFKKQHYFQVFLQKQPTPISVVNTYGLSNGENKTCRDFQ